MSLQKLYRKWKNTGFIRGEGYPATMEIDEVVDTTKKILKDCSNDINTFKLRHTKNVIVQEKKD